MTVSGWIAFVIISIFIAGGCLMFGLFSDSTKGLVISIAVAGVLCVIVLFGMLFYYNKTASGKRAYKTQESNFHGGIERTVEVYDATGNLLKEYRGKFDIDYDDSRIIFDDEENRRHVIYYPTGTVIVDEVSGQA